MISDLLAEKKPSGQDGDRHWQKTESIRAPWSDASAPTMPPGQDGDRHWQKTESIRAPWSDASAPKMQAAPPPKMQAAPTPWIQSEVQSDPLAPALAAKRTPSRAAPS